jgi:hypothetical protein
VSVHSDLVAGAATPLLLETSGETIRIQIKGADAPVNLKALLNRERTVTKQTPTGIKQVRERRATITTDEASRFGGLARVPLHSVVTIGTGDDEIDYSVAEKPSDVDGTLCLVLHRGAVEERTGQNYRSH